MTVKDIFDLRKQGRIEEAYEAIRPIYASHKGKYTTLCMFWTATDIFKLRLDQKRLDEAEKIYQALQRVIPSLEDDKEHSAARFMHYAESRLIKESSTFRKRYFAIKSKQKPKAVISSEAEKSLSTAPERLRVGDSKSGMPAEGIEGLNNSCHSSDSCSLNKGQSSVLACIQQNPGYNVPKISADTAIPAKSIERHIKALLERNLITHQGSKKTGGYYAK